MEEMGVFSNIFVWLSGRKYSPQLSSNVVVLFPVRAEVHQLKQSRGHHTNSLPRGGILGTYRVDKVLLKTFNKRYITVSESGNFL
jgi:hypothetical protein